MGALLEKIELSMKTNGGNIVDFYKENTLFMYDKYQKSDDDCEAIRMEDIIVGGFYFFQYLDDSNWMKYSPVFCADHRKVSNLNVLLAVNFNFIPLEIRGRLFDKFIIEKDFERNSILPVDFKGMYNELLKYGFEYSIVEYNVAQLKYVHRISLNLLPRFLYSSYPLNKYDPKKLSEIWRKKLETREKRHQEIIVSLLNEFYDINNDINSKYSQLEDHISRLQKSFMKYGN